MEARYLKEQLEIMLGGVEIFLDFVPMAKLSAEIINYAWAFACMADDDLRWADVSRSQGHPK